MINFIFGCIAGFIAFGCIWRYGINNASFNEPLKTIVPGMRYYSKDDKTFIVDVLSDSRDSVSYAAKNGKLYYMDRHGFKLAFKVYKKSEEGTL